VDLPTYTNIWRIEKRLYKLYDVRLPMPLPINWIAVFAGITIPYVLLLIAIGLPFNHDLVWLYVLPPGVLTWATTRPVLENKRLPELVESQVRYLTEPKTWVRLTPLSEKDQVLLTARVWHGRPKRQAPAPRPVPAARQALPSAEPGRQVSRPRPVPGPVLKPTSIFRPEPGQAAIQGQPVRPRQDSGAPQRVRAQERSRGQERLRVRDRARGSGLGQGTARRAPELPPVRSAPPAAPVVPVFPAAAPERSGPPAHAMPDVVPPAAAFAPQPLPRPGFAPNSRPAPVPPAAPAGPPAALAGSPAPATVPAPQSAPAPQSVPVSQSAPAPQSARLPGPVRARAGRSGGARLEVSHDGPRRLQGTAQAPSARPAPPAPAAQQVPPPVVQSVPDPSAQHGPATPLTPADPVRDWPVPARPLRPVPSVQEDRVNGEGEDRVNGEGTASRLTETQAFPVTAASAATAAFAPEAPASPATAPLEPDSTAPDSAPPAPVAPDATVPAPVAPDAVAPAPVAPDADVPAPVALDATVPAPVAPDADVPAPVAPEAAVPASPVPDAVAPVTFSPATATPAESAPVPATPTETPVQAPAQVAPHTESVPPTETAPPAEVVPAAAETAPPAEVVTAAAEAAPLVEEAPLAEEVPLAEAAPPAEAAPLAEAPPAPVQAPVPAPVQAPVPAPVQAPVPAPTVQQVADVKLPSIERALSGPARDLNASWGGKVKIVTGNGATHGPGARDQEALDRNRARLPISEPRRILILGCTSGAGQSVTALMTASMLASLREHPVAAVDLHDGTLARYRAPAAWLEELLAGKPPQQIRPARPDGLHPTPKPSPARLDVVASHEPLRDGDEIKLAVQLNRHYPLTLLDPGAAGLTRLLKIADQLVVVVPANVDAAGALADTRDWLDNNGHADLAMQSVTVINGVSRRSLPDVESAESIARGRSRAIVRVPWDDMLPVAAASPSTLRPQTRVAYTALAGVLVAGLAAVPVRKKQ
jgi:TcpE family